MGNSINRRQFMELGAAGAGAVILGTQWASGSATGQEADWPPPLPPVKIHKVYVGRTGGIYLSRPTEEIARFDKYLTDVQRKLGDVQFVGGELIPPTEVDAVVAKLADADGVLLFHLSGHGGDAPKAAMDRIVEAGLPTAVFSQPFSGHGWMYFPQWRKDGKKVVLLPTSDWGQLEQITRLMRVGPHLRQTRIIVVNAPQGTAAACSAEQIKQRLGTEIIPMTIEETEKAHQAIDLKAAEEEAEKYWISKAKKIVEPTRDEIISSARFYLAMKDAMIKNRARAITSSGCMGRPAKGCLTFS